MSDDEDYRSSEDEEYVPTVGEEVSEEENSGEEENLDALKDDGEPVTLGKRKRKCSKKSPKKAEGPRKRTGGIKLEGDTTAKIEEKDEANKELGEQIKLEQEKKKEENEKKRANDLWSSFMSDVGKPSPRKPATASSSLGSLTTVRKHTSSEPKAPVLSSLPASSTSLATNTPASSTSPATNTPASSTSPATNTPASSTSLATNTPDSTTSSATSVPASSTSKITVTRVYDFAGEAVKVTKELDVNSKEGKAELKRQQEEKTQDESPAPKASAVGTSGMKRTLGGLGGGLGGVLDRINKKPKMGTLEKSKIDWEQFKEKEGIDEELKIHNRGKESYIERMHFLQRTDVRQFEIEKSLRLSSSSKR